MHKKRTYLSALFLATASVVLYGGTSRPEDGMLSFLILLGFLLVLLGIVHLADYLKKGIRKYLDGISDVLKTC